MKECSFGTAVCSNEKTGFHICVSWSPSIQKLSLEEINPDVLIADGVDSIRNTLQHVF